MSCCRCDDKIDMKLGFVFVIILTAWVLNTSTLIFAQTRPQNFSVHLLRVELKPGSNADQFKKTLPEKFKIIASEGTLLVLQSKNKISPADIHLISKLPDVKDARPDRLIHADKNLPSSTNPVLDQCEPRTSENLSLGQTLRDWEKLEDHLNCKIFEKCGSTSTRRFWATEATDSDFALEELKKTGADLSLVRVAVLDSGFDLRNQKKNFPGSIQTNKAHDAAGDSSLDPNGHGTSVASMIGGKPPYGLAPGVSLTVYRMTVDAEGSLPETDSPQTSDTLIEISILRACREGNSIINVSWGDIFDDAGIVSNEKHYQEFIQKLGEKGCLVTKASGNWGNKKLRSVMDDADDSMLRVGASNRLDTDAGFSTAAEVLAPGEQVQTLKSVGSELDRALAQTACSNAESYSIDGTSFAAPAAAGMAALLRAALNQSPKFLNLAPVDQVRLMTRILTASQTKAGINSLLSVKIAQKWMAYGQNQNIQSVEELKQMLKQPPSDPICQSDSNPGNFDDLSLQCDEIRQNINRLRKQTTLCLYTNPSVANRARELLLNLEALMGESDAFLQTKNLSSQPLSGKTLGLLKERAILSAQKSPLDIPETIRYYSTYIEQGGDRLIQIEDSIKNDILSRLGSSQANTAISARADLMHLGSIFRLVDFDFIKRAMSAPSFNFNSSLALLNTGLSQLSIDQTETLLRALLESEKKGGFFDEELDRQSKLDRLSNFFTGHKTNEFKQLFLSKILQVARSQHNPKLYPLLTQLIDHSDFAPEPMFHAILSLNSSSIPENKKVDFLDRLLKKTFVDDNTLTAVTTYSLDSFSIQEQEKILSSLVLDTRAGYKTLNAVAGKIKNSQDYSNSSELLSKLVDKLSEVKIDKDQFVIATPFVDAIAKTPGPVQNRAELMVKMIHIIHDKWADNRIVDSPILTIMGALSEGVIPWDDREKVFDELERTYAGSAKMGFYYPYILERMANEAPNEEVKKRLKNRLSVFRSKEWDQ